MELRGRRVLVTGATGGLGQAIARELHRRDARLVLTGRRGDVLSGLARELEAEAIEADLAAPADVERLAAAAGEIEVLVANAGLSASGLLASFEPAEIADVLAVNLGAAMSLSRALTAGMVQRGEGHVVFVSSLSGMSGQPGATVYSATKFGLRGFAQALRAELRPSGIGVSAVLPGFVSDAGMFQKSGGKVPWFIGTSRAQAVVDAVVRSIEGNRGEIVVAPPLLRAMTRFAAAAPLTAARLARLMGGDRITAKIIADLEISWRR